MNYANQQSISLDIYAINTEKLGIMLAIEHRWPLFRHGR
jgi:hypothetical protein